MNQNTITLTDTNTLKQFQNFARNFEVFTESVKSQLGLVAVCAIHGSFDRFKETFEKKVVIVKAETIKSITDETLETP